MKNGECRCRCRGLFVLGFLLYSQYVDLSDTATVSSNEFKRTMNYALS